MRLEFREALRGSFGPGESPVEGYRAGRRAGNAFALRARAIIEDLETFESDPEHRARLEGEVDWSPAGENLPVRDGEIRLFLPRTRGRALAYEFRFEAPGRQFEVRGEKRLGRWPSLRALTTLHADLLEIGDEGGASRGVLRVPVAEVLRFGFQMRVPGRGFLGSLGATLRFLRFSRSRLLAPVQPPG